MKALMSIATAIVATAVFCGCSDIMPPAQEEGIGDRMDIRVSLSVFDPGARTRSALDPDKEKGEYTLGTTPEECEINTLTLIMMNVGDDGSETFESSRTVAAPEKTNEVGNYEFSFDLTGRSGRKRFYVGANLKQNHIGAFTTTDRVFDAGEGDTGHNIVGSLMTIDHGTDGSTGSGSDIVMTGKVTVTTDGETNDIIEIPAGSDGAAGDPIEIDIDNPIKLTRAVAKVLLTCTPGGGNMTSAYVETVDVKDLKGAGQDSTGWIRFENVNYMLNVINRKAYLDYREVTSGTEEAYLTDPNYEISDLIEARDGSYGLKDLEAYRKEFLYYDTQEMVTMLNSDVRTLEGADIEPCITRKATVFDENRIGADAVNHYTEGLYCTENMVHNDMPELSGDDFASVNRFVSTRVMIGAKYTPKTIYVLENGTLQPNIFEDEESAMKALSGQKEDSDTPGGAVEYLDGTFWKDGENNYYTLDAMKAKLKTDPNTSFSRYDGGWGYYFTYIDGQNTDGVIDNADQTRWGVKRNHYYILKVSKIIAPGSAFPGNETVRIHSDLVGWVDQGGSEVDIDVPQRSENAEQP